LIQHHSAPGAIQFDADEVWLINRAQVALLLHKTPQEVDGMSLRDVHLILEVNAANEKIRSSK
jgi:hypothetical protein